QASMEPPRERGGNLETGRASVGKPSEASMEPPRERGGNLEKSSLPTRAVIASMEPPRERGGNRDCTARRRSGSLLQWSRRVNAAETHRGRHGRAIAILASMEPPRERGGNGCEVCLGRTYLLCFNGAAA